MAENLTFKAITKQEKYKELLPQILSLISNESNVTANLANVAAALKECFNFHWVGFYVAIDSEELVLAPFQGPVACTRIKKGRGVCGTVFEKKHTIIVDDVDSFEGHIACSSLSKSEIVVPIISNNSCVAVLDIDSNEYSSFDATDKQYLEELCKKLSLLF